jgi:hypothetical protein
MKTATERVPGGNPDHAIGGDTPWPPQFDWPPPCAAGMTAFSENALDDTVIGAALAIDAYARQSAAEAENSMGFAFMKGSCSRLTS